MKTARKTCTGTILDENLLESGYPFSGRMLNFFDSLELRTIGELSAIPPDTLTRFRGFKSRCVREMIDFIEFKGIEHLFEGFHGWKERFIRANGANETSDQP